MLADSTRSKLSNAVNSVHYFAYLPYGLNGSAVHKELLGTTTLKNKEYYKIRVTFSEAGGGEDYEDVFMKPDEILERTTLVEHHIDVENETPMKQPYRNPLAVRQMITEEVTNWLKS